MKKYMYIAIACLMSMAMTGCKDHIPGEEDLPARAIDFAYVVDGDKYVLDFYVGSTINFYPTVAVNTEVKWNFGDGETAVGEKVTHKYTQAGTYQVTAEANGGKRTCTIFIADIRPIVTQINEEEGLIEVAKSYVSFNVELPNPDSLAAIYEWTFPTGTTDANNQNVGEPVVKEIKDTTGAVIGYDTVGFKFIQKFAARSLTPDVPLNKVKFAKVGSQNVKLQVKLQTVTDAPDYRPLDIVSKNVQVALNEEAPTLYYAVKDGNINALKLPVNRTIEGVSIDPYDMGVSAGQHMQNIAYSDGMIYLADCGNQFVYCNDVLGIMGDGKISVMSVDASSVGTVITNVGGPAFKDPYTIYIEGDNLYFSDRNTGFRVCSKDTRNAVFKNAFPLDEYYAGEYGPTYMENNFYSYYQNNTTMIYGCFNACFGRENGVWYWCKKGYGAGCWRFTDADIVKPAKNTYAGDPWPAAGQIFETVPTMAYVHDTVNHVYYFTFDGSKIRGVYRIPEDQLNTFHPKIDDSNTAALEALALKFADGQTLKPINDNSATAAEGMTDEYIGISQLALDYNTGDVYMCYRSSEENVTPSGVVRYNASTQQLEYVVKGVKAYGCTICPIKSKLFN